MDKKYIFLSCNLHEVNWTLVIVMLKTSTLFYFDLLLTLTSPTNQLNFITSFFNFYCVANRVQQMHCYYVICDKTF